MDGLFNSPIMKKLQDFGQSLGRNKFLSSLQAGMMSLMGIIMVGAIAQILNAVLGPSMFNLYAADSVLYVNIQAVYHYTMNSLSLWVVIFMAYHYARMLKLKNPLMASVTSVVIFMLTCGIVTGSSPLGTPIIDFTYLGAQGMFVGFIVVFLNVRMQHFCFSKNIRIKMPDIVPPFLQDGFSSIVPLFFMAVIVVVANLIVVSLTGGTLNIASGFMALLSAPLNTLVSVPGMFILTIFGTILWCFGIHGTMVIVPIIMPLSIQAAMANAAAYEAGGVEALVFYPVALFACVQLAGGTGNTWALTLMGLRSKSKQIAAVSKISVIPGWFGINEPVVFGMPIMYNPILCIPYVLNVPVVMLLTLIAYQTGFIIPGWIALSALLPIGFASYLTTLNIMNGLWNYLMLIPAGIIYYPFFKIYEKQLIEKEQAAEALETA
ncbi:MAG: PTS sugar transporter subunit IIC [Erysipelotrichaceae bacterium]